MRKGRLLANLDGLIGGIGLAVMIGTIFIQVVLRFVFSKPLMGAEELTRFMVICVVMFPLAFSERSGNTIVMEEILYLMPAKMKKIISAVIQISSTIIYFILTISTVSVIMNNTTNTTATLKLPFWLFFTPTIIGFSAITVISAISTFCKISNRRLPWDSL